MTNTTTDRVSQSSDCPSAQPNSIKEIHLRSAVIGTSTTIKRALPSKDKRMIGAWCFLDHAGPVQFAPNDGMDVGPHPHIGLQTFTWMIEGTVMHHDSVGSEQLIRPKQVNLMTAGQGISHTEVTPSAETGLHAAQLWIALPEAHRHMAPKFEHYPELPTIEQDGAVFSVLVGDFLGVTSPVQVYSKMLGVDVEAVDDVEVILDLNPEFEYGLLAMEANAEINGHALTQDNMVVLEVGNEKMHLKMKKGARILLIGGEPFESEILLWWNFVARTTEEMKEARQQWIDHDARFGEIPSYQGKRLIAPEIPDQMRASK